MTYADDVALLSLTVAGDTRLADLCSSLFAQIGLTVNPRKYTAIRVASGTCEPGDLFLTDGLSIQCIKPRTTIRYLAVTFLTDEVVSDNNIAIEFVGNLEIIRSSPLLKPD